MWGAASGANYATILQTDIYGRGGYSYGNYAMTKNQTIYVSVGGKGKEGSLTSINPGGWNGGGDGQWDHGDDESMAGGGGCCSIQKSLKGDGQLKNYESVKNADVLIVAGGGGGTNHRATNQYGGGEIAAASIRYVSEVGTNMSQATQTSGYAFGQGQSANYDYNLYKNCEVPGGGGGWYGGYTVIPAVSNSFASAGGGSGHIGTMLTNGATIAGNLSFPSPTGGTETGHSGNGNAKITWMPVL